ncbi:MAG: hypothetical protein ACM3US_01690, partial [Sphingomonadaceae bacterium]
MKRLHLLLTLILALPLMLAAPSPVGAAPGDLDYDIPGGHFYTQANGSPLGTSPTGYSITNEA